MVRRRVAAGVAVVVVIVIVLAINSCLKSEKTQGLKDYNRQVGEIAQEYDTQISKPLFSTLAGAAGKSALDVQVQVNNLLAEARKLTARAKGLSVPGEMTGAQRDLLLALDMREEGIEKIAALLPSALGGQSKQEAPKVAGDMEYFLASDVIYSQRVVPLIQQTLAGEGVHQATGATRMLPNLGWLDANTVASRLTGQSSSSSTGTVAPGTHGHTLTGVAVGTNTLEAEPTLNHIKGGSSPTFTVTFENDGSNAESNVKVNTTVTAAGKTLKASKTVNRTQPGQKLNVEVPLSGVPLGVAAKITAEVEPVAGETNKENNTNNYLAIFGE